MPTANKEFFLNYAINRWGLNKKRVVGSTSDSIRMCNPHCIQEWEEYYYSNVRSVEEIDAVGRSLYEKILTILPTENRFHPDLLASITEADCIQYAHRLVIDRQYEGYCKENGG